MPAAKDQGGYTLADERAAKDAGAKAGAKARRRIAAEGEAETAAIIAAGRGDAENATWTTTYTVEGERREMVHRADARAHLTPAELLTETKRAVNLAAERVHGKRGIPEVSWTEREDVHAELVARILESTAGSMPKRERMTRSYLVKRAEGIIMDDPARRNTQAGEGGDTDALDLDALSEAAESRARDNRAAPDGMLNPGVPGQWPELEAARLILDAHAGGPPLNAHRAVTYLVAGGSLTAKPLDLPKVWNISPKNANNKAVPKGAEWLRHRPNARRYWAAVKLARILDETSCPLDQWARDRREIERGLVARINPPRAVKLPPDRTEPDYPAPVTERTDKRIIRSAERRKRDADRAGWTKAGV